MGAFAFFEKGTFEKRGDQMRKQQAIAQQKKKEEEEEDFVEEKEEDYEKPGGAKQSEDVQIRKNVNLRPLDPIPDVEWWDKFFLPEGETEFPKDMKPEDLFQERITSFIHFPKPVKNKHVEAINDIVVPKYLTEEEKKKLRKMKRLDKERDKQEKVKLGLLPPPKPKVKLNNYLTIMGKEAA